MLKIKCSQSVSFQAPPRAIRLVSVTAPIDKESYQKGYEAAKAEDTAELERYRRVSEDGLNQVRQQFESLLEDLKRDVPELLIQLLKRIWGEAALSQESLGALLESTLKEVSPQSETLTVFASSQDFKTFSDMDLTQISHSIEIKEDPQLTHADLKIQTQFGMLDARIHQKIQATESVLSGNDA